MANISQFSRESQQRIADVVRRVEQSPPAPSQRGHRITPHAKEVRWGVTATTYEHPTYPNSGPVYAVKLGELVPSPDPPYPGATITKALVPYDPAVEIVATDRCSRCLPSRLNCREQQSCQERHYCGRDKKLNERKSAAPHNPPHRNLGAKGAF